jgi:hypothetical protein
MAWININQCGPRVSLQSTRHDRPARAPGLTCRGEKGRYIPTNFPDPGPVHSLEGNWWLPRASPIILSLVVYQPVNYYGRASVHPPLGLSESVQAAGQRANLNGASAKWSSCDKKFSPVYCRRVEPWSEGTRGVSLSLCPPNPNDPADGFDMN